MARPGSLRVAPAIAAVIVTALLAVGAPGPVHPSLFPGSPPAPPQTVAVAPDAPSAGVVANVGPPTGPGPSASVGCLATPPSGRSCSSPRPGGARTLADGGSWTDATGGLLAPSGAGLSMAYDGAGGLLLLVAHGTTWKYTPVGWMELSLSVEPPARLYGSLAYDALENETVLYGGNSVQSNGAMGPPLNDTWIFRDGVWSQVPGPSPPASTGGQMAYDSEDGYLVEANGLDHPGTWRFSSGAWTDLGSSAGVGPPGRFGGAFVDDPRDGYVLLFGGTNNPSGAGCGGCPGEFDDTWAFSGGRWTNLTDRSPDLPPARDLFGAAFDATDGYILSLAGYDSAFGGVGSNASWTYRGGSWTVATASPLPDGPCARWGAAAAYDDSLNEVIVYGGVDPDGNPCTSVVSYENGSWSSAPAFLEPLVSPSDVMTYDSGDGYVLLFGGGASLGNQTWTFRGGLWTELTPPVSPPARTGESLAYDAKDGYVVLFGGSSATSLLNDTWAFHAGLWTEFTNASVPAPPAREEAAMTYDRQDGYILLFGGSRPTAFDLLAWNDTWSFRAGVWTELRHAGPSPGERMGGVLVDDPAVGDVLLFGGTYGCDGWCSNWVFYNDTWAFHAGTWRRLAPTASPAGRAFEMVAIDPTTGDPVLFGGSAWGAALNDTWSYTNGTWARLDAGPSPPADMTAGFASDVADRCIVMLAEYWYPSPETWTYQGDAFGANFTALPEFGTSPLAVRLNASAEGGTSPLSANWTLGDGGVATGLNVLHVYDRVGTGVVTLELTDANGNRTEVSRAVSVASDLSATVVCASSGAAGSRNVSCRAVATAGAPPYAYAWTFGDGSSGASGPNVSHGYSAPGTYRAVLSVRDSGGNGTTVAETLAIPTPALLAAITASPLAGEAPLTEAFTALVSGGRAPYTFNWSFGDGGTTSGPSPTHLFAAPGSYRVDLVVHDSGTAVANATLALTVYPALTVVATAFPSAGSAPLVVSVSAAGSGGLAPYGYLWTFGDGSLGNARAVSHVYAFPGIYDLSVTVTDALGDSVGSGQYVVTVSPPPAPFTLRVVGPSTPIPLGGALALDAVASGGTGPYRFGWSGLPPGCGASPSSSVNCTPSAPGAWQPTVTSVDGSGAMALAETTVVVLARQVSLSLTVQPLPALVGSPVTVSALASGGVSPYRYLWPLSPSSCSTAAPTALLCRALPVGVYPIRVLVEDAANESASLNGTIVIVASPSAAAGTPSALLAVSVAAGAAAGALAVAAVWWRYRRKPPRVPG